MPNRMLRDWTRSDKVVNLSVHAERFFVRLIMKADDYGCYYAKPALLKADLFPLLENIRDTDVPRWLAECQKAGLIVVYEVEGKEYLQILDFKQRLDKARNRFPLPTSIDPLPTVTDFPAEVEVEVEVEKEIEQERERVAPPAPRPSNFKKWTERQFGDAIAVFSTEFPKEMLRKFYDYWREKSPTGRMKFQLEKTWDTGRRLRTWKERDEAYGKKAGGDKSNSKSEFSFV